MKVLIAAYACEPGKGSEPGIGWDWAMALAARPELDVTVLTRTNNRPAIEAALAATDDRTKPRFIYYDLPVWLRALKRLTGSVYAYYLLWCRAVRRLAADIVEREGFDVFHHLTFSTDWLPGCIPGRIGCATVIGPLGGYDTSAAISSHVPARYAVIDRIRKIIRRAGLRARKGEFRRCDMVIANNENFAATYRTLAPYCPVTVVSTQLSSATDTPVPSQKAATGGHRQILLAGRMLYWKGLDIALEGLAVSHRRGVTFDAVMVGSGPKAYADHLKSKAARLGLADRIKFVAQMPRDEFLKLMEGADLFLYPSFYGTADSIMIESVERGVPIVCLPSAGAHELLGRDYPYIASDFSAEALADTIEHAERTSEAYQTVRGNLLAKHSPARKLALIEAAYGDARRRAGTRGEVVLQHA